MLPAYRIENQEYFDHVERRTFTKPQIVFDDSAFKPLADLLNWLFPNIELLQDTLSYLDRPWHSLVQQRELTSEWANLTITPSGQASIASLTRFDLVEENGELLLMTEANLLAAYAEAIRITSTVNFAE